MEFVIDKDVKAVLEFMSNNGMSDKLVGVANALNQLAPILWGKHKPTDFNALSLEWRPKDSGKQPTAIE